MGEMTWEYIEKATAHVAAIDILDKLPVRAYIKMCPKTITSIELVANDCIFLDLNTVVKILPNIRSELVDQPKILLSLREIRSKHIPSYARPADKTAHAVYDYDDRPALKEEHGQIICIQYTQEENETYHRDQRLRLGYVALGEFYTLLQHIKEHLLFEFDSYDAVDAHLGKNMYTLQSRLNEVKKYATRKEYEACVEQFHHVKTITYTEQERAAYHIQIVRASCEKELEDLCILIAAEIEEGKEKLDILYEKENELALIYDQLKRIHHYDMIETYMKRLNALLQTSYFT